MTIDVDFLADRGVGDDARQILWFLDVLAVELDDDVARLDAGGFGRALVVDAGDQGAARGLDVEAFGDFVGDLLDADAEPAAAKLAELAQLIDHAGNRLRGHREADADRAAGRRNDQRVDADHVAIKIEQRAAGIAAVDGGVGLDVVVVRTLADVAIARRYDARRDGAAEAEGIADRDHPFAEPQLVGIAEPDRGQRLVRVRRKLQHREIGLLVDADQFRFELAAVVHDDGDFVGVRDDVIVGHDDAGGIDDEAGAQRCGLVRLQVATAATRTTAVVLEEIVEEFLERRTRRQFRHRAPIAAGGAAFGFDRLRGRDVDHRVDHLLGHIGNAVGAARERRRRHHDTGGAKADAKADRGQPGAQATTEGRDRSGHSGSLCLEKRISLARQCAPEQGCRASIGRSFHRQEQRSNEAKNRPDGSARQLVDKSFRRREWSERTSSHRRSRPLDYPGMTAAN